MGKNTPVRQEFIIENLRVEKDEIEEEDEDQLAIDNTVAASAVEAVS